MKERKRIGMTDVARIAGVSLSTVSKVLNDKDGKVPISEATRKKVLAIVDELDYKPNFAAHRLRSADPDHSVGLYIPWGWGVQGFPEFVPIVTESIGRYLFDRGCALMLVYYESGAVSVPYRELHRVRSHPIQGMIIAGANAEDLSFLESVSENRHPPFVALHRVLKAGSYVTADNRGGASQAVHRLVGDGHRRIAVISRVAKPPGSKDYVYDERLQGYRDALRESSIPPDPALEFSVDSQDEEGTDLAVENMLSRTPKPSAVFATRLDIAVHALRSLRRRGVAVPLDMSLISFAKHPTIGEYFDPKLSTVDVPLDEMGRRAAAAILEKIRPGEPPSSALHDSLPCGLTVRESSGSTP
jgi:LacI family transcriptional regulator